MTQLRTSWRREGVVDAAVAKHLATTYGARAPSVVARVKPKPALGERLDPELPYVLAQVDVAVDEEQALTVEDVLGRRVPLLLRARDQGLGRRDAWRRGWRTSSAGRPRNRRRDRALPGVVARTRHFRD